MLYSGLRIGETLSITINDIDFKNKELVVSNTLTIDENGKTVIGYKTKTKAGERTLRITPLIEKLLKESVKDYCENENKLLFTRPNGDLISTGMVLSALKRFFKSNEINEKVTNHILRHTYATRMIESGIPAHVLQKLLGHEDISITINTYVDVFDRYEKQYDNSVNDYLVKNNLVFSDFSINEIVQNELTEIKELVNKSHINNKHKELINNDIKTIKEWYDFL